jgi:hypothetical protein
MTKNQMDAEERRIKAVAADIIQSLKTVAGLAGALEKRIIAVIQDGQIPELELQGLTQLVIELKMRLLNVGETIRPPVIFGSVVDESRIYAWPKDTWLVDYCPICQCPFPYKADYKPQTCGKFVCQQKNAKRRARMIV